MKLELVVHCFKYSRCLTYQLSSLILYPPKDIEVQVVVIYSVEDQPTMDVLEFFGRSWHSSSTRMPDSVELDGYSLGTYSVLHRAIGRNHRAHETRADLVWFLDVDHVFGEGCLDALAGMTFDFGKLYYPSLIQINNNYDLGDEYALRARIPGIYDVDPKDFKDEKVRKAIGGLQIVTGDTAREFGYCDPDRCPSDIVEKCCKEQEPREVDEWNHNTKSDWLYRKQLDVGNGAAITLPNLFRIRNRGIVDSLTSPLPAG